MDETHTLTLTATAYTNTHTAYILITFTQRYAYNAHNDTQLLPEWQLLSIQSKNIVRLIRTKRLRLILYLPLLLPQLDSKHVLNSTWQINMYACQVAESLECTVFW